jgi:membrane protease YdiL (CAAX protease family)
LDRKNNPPWSLKEALIALVLVYLVNNSIGLIMSLLGINWSALSNFAFAILLQTIGIVFVVYYFAIYKHGGTGKSLGLNFGEASKHLIAGVGGGALVFSAVIISSLLVERISSVPGELQPFAQLVIQTDSLPQLLLLFLLGVILAPLGEELYFRGFLYPAIRAHFGTYVAILFSAVVFGLLHFDLLRFIPLAVGGAGLAWLYEKTNSLYVPMIAHGFWNFVMLTLLVLSR